MALETDISSKLCIFNKGSIGTTKNNTLQIKVPFINT